MKALIKSGLCLALGWLASGASAQETPIKWQAAAPKNANPIAVVSAPGDTRAITLRTPVPLDSVGGAFTPIVRMQAPDDKNVPPVPRLEVIGPEIKPAQKMPKEGFTPPPPSPILGGLGLTAEDGCFGGGPRWCGRDACGFDGCSDRPRFWATAEYLMWWQRSQSVPPLVTSSPAGTATINSGVLGQNSTSVLYDSIPDHTRSGGRFAMGTWCPHFCNLGLEFGFFSLGRQDNTAIFGGNGNPQVDRPLFNAITQKQGSQLVAINNPDRVLTGTVAVHTFSQLWGADVNLRSRWCCGDNYHLDFLVGYRYLNLYEGIEVTENLQVLTPAGGNQIVRDSFHTRNQFNGTQVGFDYECHFWGRWFLDVNSKFAMGITHRVIEIDGSTTFNPPNVTMPGGLLALPGTNIGRHSSNRFAIAPEVGIKIGFDINDHWRVFAGYDFLYLSSVYRPADQIDLRVNPNFLPSAVGPGTGVGQRVPAVPFRGSDYWAQGLNFGLLYRY